MKSNLNSEIKQIKVCLSLDRTSNRSIIHSDGMMIQIFCQVTIRINNSTIRLVTYSILYISTDINNNNYTNLYFLVHYLKTKMWQSSINHNARMTVSVLPLNWIVKTKVL